MINFKRAEFTKSIRNTHTIYMPDMLHYHNDLLKAAFAYGGYRPDIVPEYQTLTPSTFSIINKDYCTCATFIIGNLLTMIEESGCEADKIAFLEPQTGGACRAGNYYNLMIDCLRKTGNAHIPVLSLNMHGLEQHSGFKINTKMLFGSIAAVCYSDLLMTLGRDSVIEEPTAQEELAITKAMKWFRRRVIGSICVAAAVVLFIVFMVFFELPMPYEKTKLDVWLSANWMKQEVTTTNGVETRWSNELQFMLPAGSIDFYGSHKVIKEITLDGEEQCVAFLRVYDTLFYKIRFQSIVEAGNEWGTYYEAYTDGDGRYTLAGYDEYDVSDITKVYYLDRGIKWIEKADNERALELIEKYGHLVWTKEEGNQSTYYLKVLE